MAGMDYEFGKRVSRRQFLRSVGVGTAVIGATAIGMSGTARAGGGPVYVGDQPGDYPTLGAALAGVSDGDTIYVRAVPYPVMAARLVINKSLTIIGMSDGGGNRPVISGAAANGVLQINVPGKAFTLDNIEIKSTYVNAASNSNRIIDDIGSDSFVVKNCKVWGAATAALPGLGAAISCSAPPLSTSPAVTGSIVIRNTEMYARQAGVFIGWNGPVKELDTVEVSGCNIHAWGGAGLPQTINQGNWGVGFTNYPFYTLMAPDKNPPAMEGTTPATKTIISDNTITCGQPVFTHALKGDQRITDNHIYSKGVILWSGVYLNGGIMASAFRGGLGCSAAISGNDIHMWIPPGYPMLMSAAMLLGSGFFPVGGDFDNGLVAGNSVDMLTETVNGTLVPSAAPYYAVFMPTSATKLEISDNNFSGMDASIAQLRMAKNASHCSVSRNIFGGVTETNAEGLGQIDVAGMWVDGSANNFVDNDFRRSGIPGWSAAPRYVGCIFLSELSGGNYVFESGGFPPGTGGAYHQCLDYGSDNRVVGLRANSVISPGIGQIISSRVAAARAFENSLGFLSLEDGMLAEGQ